MMNKKLLALAIGAVVALPATALATGPTMYGQIDLSVESVEDELGFDSEVTGVPGTPAEAVVLRDNASRLGVRGEAETGVSGVKGFYQAEFGLQADDGAPVFAQRDIFVGLSSDMGTVKLGKFQTPLRDAQGSVDQFDDSTLDMGNHVANESRPGNVVEYTSPKIADLVVVRVAAIVDENGNTATTEGGATSASVVYASEGLTLAVAMDNSVENESLTGADLAPAMQVDATRAVVGYSTDTFEVGFLYQVAEEENNAAAATGEDTSIVLGGAFKTGSWEFKAQYGMTEGDLSGVEITALALGADYALGKSTTVYGLFGTEELDAPAGSAERTVFGVGLRQKF